MTREEAITVLQDKHDECKAFYDLAAHPEDAYPGAKEYMEALQIAIAALRGPTRELVEADKRGADIVYRSARQAAQRIESVFEDVVDSFDAAQGYVEQAKKELAKEVLMGSVQDDRP